MRADIICLFYLNNKAMILLQRFFLASILFFCLCTTNVIPKKNVAVTVTVDSILSATEQKIYLYYYYDNDFHLEDSVEISLTNRKVTLYGYIPHQVTIYLFFSKKGPDEVVLVASPNDNIEIDITEKDGGTTICKKVLGSPATNEEAEYIQRRNEIIISRLKLYAMQYANPDSIELQHVINDSIKVLNKRLNSLVVQSIKNSKNPDTVWGRLVILPSAGFSADFIKELQAEARARFPDFQRIQILGTDFEYPRANSQSRKNIQIISSLKRSKRSPLKNKKEYHSSTIQNKDITSKLSPIIGRTVLANFSLPNLQGDTVALSQFMGKYTYIEFWASWCLPCLKELYVTKRLHRKYPDNLNICLISIDTNKMNWINAIKRLELESFNNLNAIDLHNQMNKDIERLGLKTIPANYIIDPQGNIVAYDVFGSKLVNLIDSLLIK